MGRKSRLKKENQRGKLQEVPKAKPPSAPAHYLRVTMTFAALVLFFEAIVEFVIDWSPLQRATAAVSTFLLNLTGLRVATSGIHMTLPNAQWEIVADCTAIGAQVIFLAFVLAFPASKRAKALAVGAGVPFLFGINIVRLVALGWLTALSPEVAGYCHDFVWQVGFLFLVIGMWLVWIGRVVNREKHISVPA